MPQLLEILGFRLNGGTRRCACRLHGGSNRSAFSWRDDGLWHCFSCGAGGDKIALVQAVRECSFREALRFLASVAGVDLGDRLDGDEIRAELAQRQRERARLEVAAWKLDAMEERERFAACLQLHALERLQRQAGRRLSAIYRGGTERFLDETEVAWGALKHVADCLPRIAAVYYVVSFASQRERYLFALHPELRERIVEHVLSVGYVKDHRGRLMELTL